MKDTNKCSDSQLWQACAGGMVQLPSVNSKVYYFPQGQAEHAQCQVDFRSSPQILALILCRVAAVEFMADPETDEVFAKILLVPIRPDETDYSEDDISGSDMQEKPASFVKTLTQSDANNGGGFSVPRFCAETIFPKLDYSADPPLQTILVKDVHGEIWKFRHIYRGTPRRHLLTTGWSTFVNQKKLVAGDSIVFVRTDAGDLCVGIRRAKRAVSGGDESLGSYVSSYGGFSIFLSEEENKMMRSNGSGGNMNGGGDTRRRRKVRPESVIEAATLAASGQPFKIAYYPRAGTPEFCVKPAAVRLAMRIPWCPGMRFKMAFETEDSSRISWFMGTIASVKFADPIRWPNSPWRLLQVTWDEPDLLQNVTHVNPWLVELVSNMQAIHLAPFSPPRKKLRIPQHADFPFDGQFPTPVLFGKPLGPSSSPLCCLSDSTPVGIQGARHAQFLSDLQFNNQHSGVFHAGLQPLDNPTLPPRITTGFITGNPTTHDNISCWLTIGNPSHSSKKSCNGKTPQFLLFGQPILTEEQISLSSSSDENREKIANVSDGSCSTIHQNGHVESSSDERFLRYRDRRATVLGLETGHCKVFMESDDVGRSLDLSIIGSYEELYGKLADMLGIEKFEMMGHVLYRDATGAVKPAGDEPFSEFMKTARRLTILTDSSSDNIVR